MAIHVGHVILHWGGGRSAELGKAIYSFRDSQHHVNSEKLQQTHTCKLRKVGIPCQVHAKELATLICSLVFHVGILGQGQGKQSASRTVLTPLMSTFHGQRNNHILLGDFSLTGTLEVDVSTLTL